LEKEQFMTIAALVTNDPDGLTPELRKAQDAMHLPEVQEMLRKLAAHNLGVFMPHMHDDDSGGFQHLPGDLVQVERGLKVTFEPADQTNDAKRFVPVGWVWHDDGVKATAKCVMKCEKRPGDSMHYQAHKPE
jgi:hypothetical protein